MARFPRTIGDILAAQASASRDIGTSVLGVPELAPITIDGLDVALQNNINVVNENIANVQETMAQIDEAQGQAVSDLLQLNKDLATLDGRLAANDAKQLELDAALAANDEAQAANDAYLLELDGALDAHKKYVDDTVKEIDDSLSGLNDDLALIPTKISNAIDAANAIPLTDERFTEASLTIWPFIDKAIPKGAFDVGAISGPDLADFSIHAKKFNDNRHRLY